MVSDHKRRIRDIFIGFPGSVHDSRVFRNSPLCEALANKCGDYHILGDSAYPCLNNLLTPYRDRGNLSRRQRNYNSILSANRYVVEHCFGLLKQKFRQLYHLKLRDMQSIAHFIRACAVLHNMSLHEEFPFEDVAEEEAVENDAPQEGEETGNEKRLAITNQLRLIY